MGRSSCLLLQCLAQQATRHIAAHSRPADKACNIAATHVYQMSWQGVCHPTQRTLEFVETTTTNRKGFQRTGCSHGRNANAVMRGEVVVLDQSIHWILSPGYLVWQSILFVLIMQGSWPMSQTSFRPMLKTSDGRHFTFLSTWLKERLFWRESMFALPGITAPQHNNIEAS